MRIYMSITEHASRLEGGKVKHLLNSTPSHQSQKFRSRLLQIKPQRANVEKRSLEVARGADSSITEHKRQTRPSSLSNHPPFYIPAQ